MLLKLSISSESLETKAIDDAWLPAELSPFPPAENSSSTQETKEVTLSLCFMRGQYFLKEDKEWVPLDSQKRLKINNSYLTLSPQKLPTPPLFKRKAVAKNTKLKIWEPRGVQDSLDGLVCLNPALTQDRIDPLDFLKKGSAFKAVKLDPVHSLVVQEEE